LVVFSGPDFIKRRRAPAAGPFRRISPNLLKLQELCSLCSNISADFPTAKADQGAIQAPFFRLISFSKHFRMSSNYQSGEISAIPLAGRFFCPKIAEAF
jgi:hypothetical protein